MTRRLSWPITAGVLTAAAIIGIVGGGLMGADSRSNDQPSAAAEQTATSSPEPSDSESPETASGTGLMVEASETEVSQDARVDFTGELNPPIEGVELQVERSIDGGDWEDFPVTVTTNDDGSFSTWVASGRVGENEFRLSGEADGQPVESNTVTVRVD